MGQQVWPIRTSNWFYPLFLGMVFGLELGRSGISPLAIAQDPRVVECVERLKELGISPAEAFQECTQDPEARLSPQPTATPPPSPLLTLPPSTATPTIEPSPTPEPTDEPDPSSPAASDPEVSLTGSWVMVSGRFQAKATSKTNCTIAQQGGLKIPIRIIQEGNEFQVVEGVSDLIGPVDRDSRYSGGSPNQFGVVIENGTISGNQIRSSWPGSSFHSNIETEGTLSSDGNEITGTAVCGSTGAELPFTLTRQ